MQPGSTGKQGSKHCWTVRCRIYSKPYSCFTRVEIGGLHPELDGSSGRIATLCTAWRLYEVWHR